MRLRSELSFKIPITDIFIFINLYMFLVNLIMHQYLQEQRYSGRVCFHKIVFIIYKWRSAWNQSSNIIVLFLYWSPGKVLLCKKYNKKLYLLCILFIRICRIDFPAILYSSIGNIVLRLQHVIDEHKSSYSINSIDITVYCDNLNIFCSGFGHKRQDTGIQVLFNSK